MLPNHIWQSEQLQAGSNEGGSDRIIDENSSRVWQSDTLPSDCSVLRTVAGGSVGGQIVLQEGQASCQTKGGRYHDTEPQVPTTPGYHGRH